MTREERFDCLTSKLQLTKGQAESFVVNMIFLTTFYHSWTHHIVGNSNQDYFIINANLNQLNYALVTQGKNDNTIIKTLRDRIDNQYPGYGRYVVDIHK